jgi:diacylglycerol kinase (ATP)
MQTRFIFNPRSGRSRRYAGLPAAIRAFIAGHRLDADLVCSDGPGHATELARDALAAGCERVVAVGGDGTMNETAQALVNTPAALALVPCGSGNGLALHLGIPVRPRRALALLADPAAAIAVIDSGTANGYPFFNVMGLGFDAEISRRFNDLPRRGPAAYARAGLGAFRHHRGQRVTVSANGGPATALEAFLVAVANSDQYGNRARLAPRASVTDGRLDLVAVRSTGFWPALPLLARLFLGTFDRSSRVVHLKGARFVVERPAPGLIHTDGETHETGATIEIAVRPRSLRLVVPAGCPAAADPATSLPPWKRNASMSAR